MTTYEEVLSELNKDRCGTCYGTGCRNDAELGDTSFKSWACEDCDGTGLISRGKDWE